MGLKKIRQELVNRAFPELRGVPISENYARLEENYMVANLLSTCKYLIEVNPVLRGVDRPIVRGVMCHELVHISDEQAMDVKESQRDCELYENSIAYRLEVERQTDLKVIERGFGNDLLAFLDFAERVDCGVQRGLYCYGLSADEVREMLGIRSLAGVA